MREKELNFILILILIALIIFNIVFFQKQLFVKEIINTVQAEHIKILEQSLQEQIQEKEVYMKMLEQKKEGEQK